MKFRKWLNIVQPENTAAAAAAVQLLLFSEYLPTEPKSSENV